jgi:4,5-dihydroxyphthalate decarboxylase
MTYTVVLGNSPHAQLIKNGEISVPGADLEFPEIDPVHKAFAPMVRELRYDFSELAIATYLQAREAGKPISLLPLVLVGGFHHGSLVRLANHAAATGPRDLIGGRVGVRSYTQTTGLWVRGVLREEFGVEADEITWVTTEGPHVAEYSEPASVVRTASSLAEALRDGDIAAAIGLTGPGLTVPVIPDPGAAALAWADRHHTTPVNHMLTVRTELIDTDPGAVRGLYEALTQAIDLTRAGGAITYGLNDVLLAALEIAIGYAREQDLLRKPVTVDEIFADFQRLLWMRPPGRPSPACWPTPASAGSTPCRESRFSRCSTPLPSTRG